MVITTGLELEGARARVPSRPWHCEGFLTSLGSLRIS